MNLSTKIKLVGAGFAAVLLLIVTLMTVQIESVAGNQMGVQEDWWVGVHAEAYQPKTYFLIPGFAKKIYTYDMSSRVYVMNDTPSTIEFAQGRSQDSYHVQSKEGQDMHISMNIRWRLNPEHLVSLHKTVRNNFEEKLIRPVLMRVVKDEATQREAIAAYSGMGLVELQRSIYQGLTSEDSELVKRGIIVENFVIESIRLDPAYIEQIKGRQIALQKELRAVQEEKAALAEAAKAEAEARADYNRQVVAAERDKQVGILKAEERAKMEVLEAEAAKAKQVLAAEGEKDASELRAQAIVAVGTAEAISKKLSFEAYSVDGADKWVKVEVARHMATAFQNIKGYLPSDMKIFTLGQSFDKAIESVVKPTP